mmetsp:Transcript_36055/g.75910  ORF Transcript_36055/g.75910 Transcript_36055/m.75910 type:complete len:94 (-) Transcript_36055:219-500(-)
MIRQRLLYDSNGKNYPEGNNKRRAQTSASLVGHGASNSCILLRTREDGKTISTARLGRKWRGGFLANVLYKARRSPTDGRVLCGGESIIGASG